MESLAVLLGTVKIIIFKITGLIAVRVYNLSKGRICFRVANPLQVKLEK